MEESAVKGNRDGLAGCRENHPDGVAPDECHCWSGCRELSLGKGASKTPQRRIHSPETQRAEAKGEEKRPTPRTDNSGLLRSSLELMFTQ